MTEEDLKEKVKVIISTNKSSLKTKDESCQERFARFGLNSHSDLSYIKIGAISQIVENSIVVKAEIHDILDLKNLLFFKFCEKFHVLGKIHDVIGNIICPYYQVYMDSYLETR